jgi:DNA-directed RNA polymerase subunit RPC12/RpoP
MKNVKKKGEKDMNDTVDVRKFVADWNTLGVTCPNCGNKWIITLDGNPEVKKYKARCGNCGYLLSGEDIQKQYPNK